MKLRSTLIMFLTLLYSSVIQAQCDTALANKRRVQIREAKAPFSYVVQTTMQRGSSYKGTSFFIHPRVLLTAGHNVRKRPQFFFTRVRSLTLRVGCTGPDSYLYKLELPTNQDQNIYANHSFNRKYSSELDYGIIILPDDSAFQKSKGVFKLAIYDSLTLKGKNIHIASYPADKEEYTLWNDETGNYFFNNKLLNYEFATDHGSSGAPIWFNMGEERVVFAIHTLGGKTCNSATLITKEIYDDIVSFCKNKGIDLTK